MLTNLMAFACLVVTVLQINSPAVAQVASDTSQSPTILADSANPVVLPGIVVTADRMPLPLLSTTNAAYVVPVRLSQQSFRPVIANFVNSMPGLRAYSTGNPWGQAAIDVRGFYGGGQSQYLLMTYDGIPLNDISSGMVDLSDYSLLEVDRLEALNGPASAQYGDFGFGGTLTLLPAQVSHANFNRGSLALGSFDGVEAGLRLGGHLGSRDFQATESFKSNDGWRTHSALKTQRAVVILGNQAESGGSLNGICSYGHTREQVPGPLTQDQLSADRTAAGTDLMGNSLTDLRDRDKLLAGLTSSVAITNKLTLKPVLYAKYERSDDIVTITNALGHGTDLFSSGGEVSVRFDDSLFGHQVKLVGGFSGEYGHLETDYTVAGSGNNAAEAITRGTGKREVAAAFAGGLIRLIPRLFVAPGVRIDYVKTRFEYKDALITRDRQALSQSETVASPRVAVGADIHEDISVYASVAKAFKSPTLVLLYDSPPVYSPMLPPPGYLTLSNGSLKSMRGTSYEAGIRFANFKSLYASLSAFWYQIRNEVEFDPVYFRYTNLGRSRHRGLELAISATALSRMRADVALSYNDAVSDSGEFKGNQVNGVPKYTYDLGLTCGVTKAWQLQTRISGIGQQYLSLETQQELGDYATVSLGTSVAVSGLNLSIGVQNVFDKLYNVDGYFDPMRQQYLYYPAPGRTVVVAVNSAI
ncbi:hypothetical protein C3F09_12330 [candidate division GN15 bacterium]|uniref:TonB-dependent receptor n=1 Tax=candidate division GN15 bacterium TaxID=2072418 RepID=A0A855X2V4_9BACT|nr:MAG: hypothetical protein C3F09_12330 [candidate division GN15 bacterium]